MWYGFCWIFAISVKVTSCLRIVDIGRSVLENLIRKVPDEIPNGLMRIHINRTYNEKLINHPLFQRDQMWSPYRCSGCLRPMCIQNNDLRLYVQGFLLLKEQRVVDTKLRFSLSASCMNNILSSHSNTRPLGNKSVEKITATEKEEGITKTFNIGMDKLLWSKSLIFIYIPKESWASKPIFEEWRIKDTCKKDFLIFLTLVPLLLGTKKMMWF